MSKTEWSPWRPHLLGWASERDVGEGLQAQVIAESSGPETADWYVDPRNQPHEGWCGLLTRVIEKQTPRERQRGKIEHAIWHERYVGGLYIKFKLRAARKAASLVAQGYAILPCERRVWRRCWHRSIERISNGSRRRG